MIDKTRIKLICFDMDGTLITNNTWFDFNIAMGITAEEDEKLYSAYSAKLISYDEWINTLREHYKGASDHSYTYIQNCLSKFVLREGAKETISYLKNAGYQTALLTGSFEETAQAVSDSLGINFVYANTRCIFYDNQDLKDISYFGEEVDTKVQHLESLCTRLNILPTQCAVVGDGSNDLGVFGLTGNGITFNFSSEKVKQASKYTINKLTELTQLF
jgi:phosphoserine phosphatase